MRILKNILASALLFVVMLLAMPSALAQQRDSKLPKYLPDSISKALTRITISEVAGSYVKVEQIKVVGDDKPKSDTISDGEKMRPQLEIRASEQLSFYPMREKSVEKLYNAVCIVAGIE